MAIDFRSFLRVVIVLILFETAYMLDAQTSEYIVNTEGDEVKIYQRLAWAGGEYALRYEVIIERRERRAYEDHVREFTTNNFVEVSLSPGEYRFRVIPYDILDRPSEGTSWVNFQVLQYTAPKPEPESKQEPEPKIEIAKEPKVKKPLPVRIKIGAAWMPLFQVYGSSYAEEIIFPSAVVRLGVLYPLHDIDIGLEAAASWHMTGSDHSLEAGINIIAMKWLPGDRFAIGARFGAVSTLLWDQNQFGAVAGVSFHWRAAGVFLLEAGIDYANLFEEISSGSFRPWLGVALQF